MALLPAAFVDGGRVPASMMRRISWMATSGEAGVVQPNDFKVTALSTPGASVNINAGGAVLPTRYSNSTQQQSYVIANDTAFTLPIAAAGASGRTDYVVARISDPEYAGSVPADPLTALYCSVETRSSLPTTYPYVALAKIVLPANATTVTNAMITDLRTMANPRNRMEVGHNLPAAKDGISGAYDDLIGIITVDVPPWATFMRVKGDFASFGVKGATVTGEAWVQVEGVNGARSRVKGESPSTNNTYRLSTVGVWNGAVPTAVKGKTVDLRFYMKQTATAGGRLVVDEGSTLAALVEFEERTI